jgi:diguanylate cyclase (GGDEF)-like protein/PAS domain S-box-containing protein
MMNYKNLLTKLKSLQVADKSTLTTLYAVSGRSLVVLLILTVMITVFLYPVLSYSIVIWCAVVVLFLVYRLYCAYVFNVNNQRYSLERWYKIFTISAMLTAFFYAMLAFLFLPNVDPYYQLFIVAAILGLSAGSGTSLSADFRIAIGYTVIMMVPLIVSLLIYHGTEYFILEILISLYALAQIVIILNTYRQRLKIQVMGAQEVLIRNLFKEAPLGMFSYDDHLIITDHNTAMEDLFRRQDINGSDLNEMPDTRAVPILKRALTEGPQSYAGPYKSIKGDHFWIEVKCFPFSNDNTQNMGGIAIIEDKTKEHIALEQLEFLAHHDPLTDLLNRRGFRNYMNELVSGVKHKKSYSLMFYMDLDQFKGINDSLGHAVGDEVLLLVSKRLVYMLDSSCSVSRLGGDEFVVIVPYIAESENEAKEKAHHYEKELIDMFEDPFIVEDLHLWIRSSIGMIIIEPRYSNIEEIIRHADITMYQAKNSNAKISYYNEELDKEHKALFELQHDLASAVDKGQFDLFFQPIVTIKEDALCSAEALIRWEHPSQGLLSPDDFIPLAIKSGLLSQITWWVLEKVCTYIAEWKKRDQWKLDYIAININAQQLVENNFATKFLEKLKEHKLETSDITIEITERSLIDNFDNTQDVINTLRKKGVKCAVDDFGIGYSSLSYLKKLSFNTLKIDREFIKDIESNPNELLLVSTILDIGRQFNYNIVIEGIEDKKQKNLLIGLDENLNYQGYYFSKPLHADEFTQKFLKTGDEL